MRIRKMELGAVAATMGAAFGGTLLLAATAMAHEGHVVGTGIAASVTHALEHALGALAIGAVGIGIAWRLRRDRRRAASVLVRRRDFS